MNWMVKMIQQVCQVFSVALEKRNLIERMENMFSEVTMELVELVMAGEKRAQGSKLILSHGEFKRTVVEHKYD